MNTNILRNGYIQLQCCKTQALNERLKPVLTTNFILIKEFVINVLTHIMLSMHSRTKSADLVTVSQSINSKPENGIFLNMHSKAEIKRDSFCEDSKRPQILDFYMSTSCAL